MSDAIEKLVAPPGAQLEEIQAALVELAAGYEQSARQKRALIAIMRRLTEVLIAEGLSAAEGDRHAQVS